MSDLAETLTSYRGLLNATRELYRSSARLVEREHPELIAEGQDLAALMEDLHWGLVLRVYFAISDSDQVWTRSEQQIAEELAEHLWGKRLTDGDLNRVMSQSSAKTRALPWATLVGPFVRLPPLRDHVAELETLVVRQSNLIARVDGVLSLSERAAIQGITDELRSALGTDQPAPPTPTTWPPTDDALSIPSGPGAPKQSPRGEEKPARSLDEVLAEFDRLVGLRSVKEELRSLSNYVMLQKRRSEAGYPSTEISLHLVFTGNPGTGKTTVARLFGEAMRALGVLRNGHLVETDRSGLVAEFAGQTGPKTNQKVDEALDGVLFIDEAYGLVDSEADDPFGREALQALLKRAEDDRQRLAVVLAGYPREMGQLLDTNPGLASRFSRTIHFVDYGVVELCEIFGRLMDRHHYRIHPTGRLRVVRAISDMHANRDARFGNGRAVRNLFEQAILGMANRIAGLATLDDGQLITFEPEDIPLESVDAWDPEAATIRLVCPSCKHDRPTPGHYIGSQFTCPKCDGTFTAQWCELA